MHIGVCEPSQGAIAPTDDKRIPEQVEALRDRLILGGSPDEVYYELVERCGRYFDENPHDRQFYTPILKTASQYALMIFPTADDLWRIAEPTLAGEAPKAPEIAALRKVAELSKAVAALEQRCSVLEDMVTRGISAKAAAKTAPPKRVIKTVVTRSGVTHRKRG